MSFINMSLNSCLDKPCFKLAGIGSYKAFVLFSATDNTVGLIDSIIAFSRVVSAPVFNWTSPVLYPSWICFIISKSDSTWFSISGVSFSLVFKASKNNVSCSAVASGVVIPSINEPVALPCKAFSIWGVNSPLLTADCVFITNFIKSSTLLNSNLFSKSCSPPKTLEKVDLKAFENLPIKSWAPGSLIFISPSFKPSAKIAKTSS